MLAVALAALRYASLPRWLAWVSGAVGALVGIAVMAGAPDAGYIPGWAWLLVTSLALTRHRMPDQAHDQGAMHAIGARAARVVPNAAALAAAAATVAAIVLRARASAGGPRLRFADMVVGLSFPVAAAVVLRRDPRNRAGWLLVASGGCGSGPLLNQVPWHRGAC